MHTRSPRAVASVPALMVPMILLAALLVLVVAPVTPAGAGEGVVAVTADASGARWWVLSADGRVLPGAGAPDLGHGRGRAAAMAADPGGDGYWIATGAGEITAHGSAVHHGDLTGLPLNSPVVAMAAARGGDGYWLVAADGGVFAFGSARFHGSAGGLPLVAPVVGMAATPGGDGYWLIAADGGVFSYGAAPFLGSAGGLPLVAPVVGMAATRGGDGYWLIAADGGVFSYGAAPFAGSAGGGHRRDGVAVAPTLGGYLVAYADGALVRYPGATPALSRDEALARDVAARVDAERRARGLPALRWDDDLARGATVWSETMATTGRFAHADLSPVLVSLTPGFEQLGENIYWASGSGADAGSAHVALMGSASHRRALLDPGLTHIGIGVHCGADGLLWLTQRLGRETGAAPPGPAVDGGGLVEAGTGGIAC